MIAVTKSGACGNSPKNAFAEDFTVEVLTAAVESLRTKLADGIQLFVGTNVFEGTDSVLRALRSELWGTLEGVTITHALTHGRVGASNGIMRVGGRNSEFCVVLEFANLKCESVAAIKVYRL